ncbi:ATP synthase F1 subunit epsilon [Pseudoramibacter alactolyticus]|uniref:ATP synthase F1 subunit epsilon n=1 Tax=Pseudoramibacter alactolyticus TaxID=113287 RepID=UPI0028EEA5D0|nr:ATP synthase F1 subunit epsilon [Pseudoramibacter alactolyticus]
MTRFELKVVASDHVFYDGPCVSLTIPCTDGEKQILAHHEATLMAMTNGVLRMVDECGNTQVAVTGMGFAEVADNKVTVIVDTVEKPEEIDANRARRAKVRAEERLRQKQSIHEYYKNQAALSRAMARLKLK